MKVNLEGAEEFAQTVADLVIRKLNNQDSSEKDEFLNVEQVAELIGYKKTSIYGLVKKNRIPYHKNGKLFFLKSDIIEWLKNSKKPSKEKLRIAADKYIFENSLY